MAGDDGRVTGWTIGAMAFDASAAVKQQVSDFYATKWGPHRKTQSGERLYGTMPWVKVDEQFILTTISTEPQPM